MHKRQVKTSIEMVNLCNAKQVAQWFRQRKVDEAYLALNRPFKDGKQEVVPVVLEKSVTGCDVEKAYHNDMPEQIKTYLVRV